MMASGLEWSGLQQPGIPRVGSFFAGVFGIDPDFSKIRSNLSAIVQEKRWMSEVRMPRECFRELLGLVVQHMPHFASYA